MAAEAVVVMRMYPSLACCSLAGRGQSRRGNACSVPARLSVRSRVALAGWRHAVTAIFAFKLDQEVVTVGRGGDARTGSGQLVEDILHRDASSREGLSGLRHKDFEAHLLWRGEPLI